MKVSETHIDNALEFFEICLATEMKSLNDLIVKFSKEHKNVESDLSKIINDKSKISSDYELEKFYIDNPVIRDIKNQMNSITEYTEYINTLISISENLSSDDDSYALHMPLDIDWYLRLLLIKI